MFWTCWNTKKFWYEVPLQKKCDIFDRIFSRSKCSISVSVALASRTVCTTKVYKRDQNHNLQLRARICNVSMPCQILRKKTISGCSNQLEVRSRYSGPLRGFISACSVPESWLERTGARCCSYSVYLCISLFCFFGPGARKYTTYSLFSVTIRHDCWHHSPDFGALQLHSVFFMVFKLYSCCL